jgi:hypothetical protein
MTIRTLGVKERLTPFKELKRAECTSGKCQTEMKNYSTGFIEENNSRACLLNLV